MKINVGVIEAILKSLQDYPVSQISLSNLLSDLKIKPSRKVCEGEFNVFIYHLTLLYNLGAINCHVENLGFKIGADQTIALSDVYYELTLQGHQLIECLKMPNFREKIVETFKQIGGIATKIFISDIVSLAISSFVNLKNI